MRHLLLLLLFLPFVTVSQELEVTARLTNENGLAQNTVTELCLDNDGRIWIGTQTSLHVYNGFNIEQKTEISTIVLDLHYQDGKVYCITNEGVCQFDLSDNSSSCHTWKKQDYYHTEFAEDKIILRNEAGVPQEVVTYELESLDPGSATTKKPIIGGLFTLGGDSLLFSENELAISGAHQLEIADNSSSVGLEYGTGRYFIGSFQGLYEVALQSNTKPIVRKHFGNERIEALMVDSDKNLWVGTADHGLFMIHRNALLTSFYPFSNKGQSLACWEVFDMNNKLYVTTSEGVKALGNHRSNITRETNDLFCISGISRDDITIIGTAYDGIFRYKNGDLIRMYSDRKETLGNSVTHLDTNRIGFLASTKKGFVQLNKRGYVHNLYTNEEIGIEGYVMHFQKTASGYTASSTKGIYYLTDDLKMIRHVRTPSASVITMTSELNGEEYATSLDGKLYTISNNVLTEKLDLDDQLQTISNFKNEDLWLTGSTSIIQYEPEIHYYNSSNGFPLKEYNQNGQYRSSDGEIYFSGVGGVIRLNPSYFPQNQSEPSFILRQNKQQVNANDSIFLPHYESNVALDVELISLANQQELELICYLDSQVVSMNGSQLLVNVGYGDSSIIFELKRKGRQAKKIGQIDVFRAIPFYAEWWFKVVAILVGIALLIGFISLFKFLQTRRLLRKEQADKRMNEERLRISRELHDNIGSRLTHIISSLDIEEHKNEANAAPLQSINSFARETMSQLRETIWAVSDQSIFFSEFITRVEQYLEQSTKMSSIEFEMQKGNVKDFELQPVQTINFFRIVQEAINNAMKYADPEKIVVKISENQKEIEIAIIDNGKGFNLNSIREGTGIRGMKSRAKEIEGEIQMFSSPGAGTEVFLRFKR